MASYPTYLGKLVHVVWQDAKVVGGWHLARDAAAGNLETITQAGWVLRYDDDVLVLALSKPAGDVEDSIVGSVTVPAGWVRYIKVLQEPQRARGR